MLNLSLIHIFRMYDTDKPVDVELQCKNHIANAIIDRFGKAVQICEINDQDFRVTVKVCASPTFYRWVFGWNGDMRIMGPDNVKAEYKAMCQNGLEA